MEVQHTLKVVASDLGYNLVKDEELNEMKLCFKINILK